MKTAGMFAVCTMILASASAVLADSTLDYFVVSTGANKKAFVFTYDTVGKTLNLVSTVTVSHGGLMRVAAGAEGSFWFGFDQSDPEGVERCIANAGKTVWSNHFAINMGSTASGAYYDTTLRTPPVSSTDVVRPGAAELRDGTFMVSDSEAQSAAAGRNTYAIGTVNPLWSGDLPNGNAGFTAPSGGGYLNSASYMPRGNVVDMTSTLAGSSNRFIVTSTGNTPIGVYNSDGSYRGLLTDLSTPSTQSAVGTMKSQAMGDVALILATSGRADGSAFSVAGRSVAEADFNNQVIGTFTPALTGSYRWIDMGDVDGTQSGLILVCGEARGGASGDGAAVRFYKTDGSPDSAVFDLRLLYPADTEFGSYPVTAAALYFQPSSEEGGGGVPEPASLGLLLLGLPLLLRRRG